ncbi:histone-like nucleoid-structuring protein Lsr2 [Streptomyces sp. N35]|uniref:Lsr2 family DNA-binding protein n=1 Tax=Streptomyces sp. N35 TaxID=2795730 RepID=UPI0018F40172|nr:histone-like nucleoid-structuring protein Lsr2 [Streptomyces sp. N35]
MFTDVKEALSCEALELSPLAADQHTAASQVVAHNARSKDDLADLLDALGLPCADDDLTALLPLLTSPAPSTGGPMPANDYIQKAATRLTNGERPEDVRQSLGLSEDEVAEATQLAAAMTAPRARSVRQDAGTMAGAAAPPPRAATDSAGGPDLLEWADHHPLATIRKLAARIRKDRAELLARRADEDAQREAEERVTQAKAELDAAQALLRALKSGARTTAAGPDDLASRRRGATPASTSKRSKEELNAIRTWGRTNGYPVADRGTPSKSVLDAYDAAHHRTSLAEAG